jgi:hypothetical protein
VQEVSFLTFPLWSFDVDRAPALQTGISPLAGQASALTVQEVSFLTFTTSVICRQSIVCTSDRVLLTGS